MQKLKNGERYCPQRRFKKCLTNQCALWADMFDEQGNSTGGECALHALGYLDYTVQAIAQSMHDRVHGKQAAPTHGKGKRK